MILLYLCFLSLTPGFCLILKGLVKPISENLGLSVDHTFGSASEYTKLHLHTRETGLNFTEVFYENSTSLRESSFDVNRATKILIHGWLPDVVNPITPIRDAYLAAQDVNVVVVDWSKRGDNLIYPIAREAVVPVGKFIAQVVDWIHSETGMSLDTVHIVGHSLGAQIGGTVGEHVTSGQIVRITGLDPAAPLFTSSESGRLDSSDATFVDVIHTCGGFLGWFDPCGHVDFYPNKGTYNQPGCPSDLGRCSHLRSCEFFAESIFSDGFVSTKCDSWESFTEGQCQNSPKTVMGEYVGLSSRGTHYLHTAGESPYALESDTTF